MAGFVDLHAHYLPGVDDGATDLAMSLQMVRAVASLGFTDLYATPHQRADMFLPSREQIAAAHQAVTQELPGADAPRLGLAAENFWDHVLLERLPDLSMPSYAGGPAFLFEVSPQLMPAGIEASLFSLRVRGRLPVMAHPERYLAVQQQLDRAEALGRVAALVVDLAAIDGAHGKPEMRTVRQLLCEGLVHAAATDIHRPEDQRAVAAGMAWVKKQLGPAALEQLLAENPRRILSGDMPEPVAA
jgi:protein-tyrosine phosphatase